GPGWVFELTGYHFYNKRIGSEGSQHVRKTLITNLMTKPIALPDNTGQIVEFLPDELGLQYALLLNDEKPKAVQIANPDFDPDANRAAMMAAGISGMPGGGAIAGPTPGAVSGDASSDLQLEP